MPKLPPYYILIAIFIAAIIGCASPTKPPTSPEYEIIEWQWHKNYGYAGVYVPERMSLDKLSKISEKIKGFSTLPISEGTIDFHTIKSTQSRAFAKTNYSQEVKGDDGKDFNVTFICGISKEDYNKYASQFKNDKRDILGVWLEQDHFKTVYKDKGNYFLSFADYYERLDSLYLAGTTPVEINTLPSGAMRFDYTHIDTTITLWGSWMGLNGMEIDTTTDSYYINKDGQMARSYGDEYLLLERVR